MDINATDLHQKIDSIDTKLVRLLNERARVLLNIGKEKKDSSSSNGDEKVDTIEAFIPGNEKQVFEKTDVSCSFPTTIFKKLKYLNNGPLSSDSLHAIYREIMSASISLQRETSVAYFGSP
ncbi:15821_t:CDS:2, partial [Dentiscutata heterogama]